MKDKKILKDERILQSEKLDDKELEKVSGGYVIDYLEPMIDNIIKLFENNKNKSNTNS